MQVGTGETHPEHVLPAEAEFLLYVVRYFWSGGGGECEERFARQQFPEVAEGKVTGAEVEADLETIISKVLPTERHVIPSPVKMAKRDGRLSNLKSWLMLA